MKYFLLIILFCCSSFLVAQYENVSTYSGTSNSGYFNGNLENARYFFPYGLSFDGDKTIYLADALNHCIRKIDISTGQVTTFAGTTSSGFSDGVGTSARFYSPTGTFYKNGYVYVADNLNNAIRKIEVSSGMVTTVAGTGFPGIANGLAANAEFYQPKSLVVDDSGAIYVADYENHSIRKIKNGIVSTFAGENGVAGNADGILSVSQFHRPRDLTFDLQGNLFVCDLMNNLIRKISNGNVTTFVGNGSAGGNDGIGTQATFNHPAGIEFYKGELYVVDGVGNKIRKIRPDGTTTTIAGSGTFGYEDGVCANASFSLPQDLTIDHEGNIYVSDRDNNVIRVIKNTAISISETTTEKNLLKIFPNPSSDLIRIEFPKYLGEENYELSLINALGEQLLQLKIKGSATTLNVKEYSKGIYFLKLISSNKSISTTKLILD